MKALYSFHCAREKHFMIPTTERWFSDEDIQLIETHQLGTPQGVYRLKSGAIRFQRITGLLIFSVGIVTLVFSIYLALTSGTDFWSGSLFPAVLGSLYALFHGGVFYSIMTRRARSMRVIICEQGLLQVRKMVRRNSIEVMRWNDILTVKKEFLSRDYFIIYQDDKRQLPTPLTLSSSYQHLDELVTVIRQRSKEVSSE